MHWYVSNEGNVAGPLTVDEVRDGIADGTIEAGMHVRDEHGQWGPIELSPFGGLLPQPEPGSDWVASPVPVVAKRESASLTSWWVAIGIAGILGCWMLWKGWRQSQPQQAWAVPTTKFVYEAPPPQSECRIRYKDTSDPVLVFPTEEGYRETWAAVDNPKLFRVVRVRSGGFHVASGTKCSMMRSAILGPSKVMLLEGDHEGTVVYVALDHAWTR